MILYFEQKNCIFKLIFHSVYNFNTHLKTHPTQNVFSNNQNTKLFLIRPQEKNKKLIAEGWEYAPLFTMKFRLRERKMDLVRRRRWHRKMIPQGTSKSESAIFQFSTNLVSQFGMVVYGCLRCFLVVYIVVFNLFVGFFVFLSK